MRIFRTHLFRLFLFIAVLCLVDYGLSLCLSSAYTKLRTAGIGGMIHKTIAAKADVVVLGSSRAIHHFDPTVLEPVLNMSVYNAGRDGQGIPYMLGICDLLLKEYSPKLLILQIGPPSLRSNGYHDHLQRVCRMAPYMDKSPVIKEMIYEAGPYQHFKHLSRTFRYNSKFLYFLYDPFKKDNSIQGYVPLNKAFVAPEGTGHAQKHHEPFIANTHAIESLKKIFQMAKEKGVGVVMVTSPRWPCSIAADSDDLKLFALLEDLADEQQVPYIKIISEDYPQFKDSSLFVDSAHLNGEGAKIFSRILTSQLIKEFSAISAQSD